MPSVVYVSSSDFAAFPAFPPEVREDRAVSATPLTLPSAWRAAAKNPKTLVPPFFDRFSPFSTGFPPGLRRDSFDESRVGPFSGFATPLENGEIGENGTSLSARHARV